MQSVLDATQGKNYPASNLVEYSCHKHVFAGEITHVTPGGAYVKDAFGTPVFHMFTPGMTARYTPVPGDFWVVYDHTYEAISPRGAFLAGYARAFAPKPRGPNS
jgi:hypothetical protein